MKCCCGHDRAYHLDGRRRCMVGGPACDCVWFCSRASWLAGRPIAALAWLVSKLAR